MDANIPFPTQRLKRFITGVWNKWQREYEEFKIRINALVAKAQRVPEEGWTMQDGTPWPGNNTKDHPGMIQVNILTNTCQ